MGVSCLFGDRCVGRIGEVDKARATRIAGGGLSSQAEQNL